MDWTSIQIRPDPKPVPIPATEVGIRCDQSEKYLEVYFDQFHHRWPIPHRPSTEEEVNETDLCGFSMRMIGAWLLGNDESVQFAEQTHTVLVNHIMSQLVGSILSERLFERLTAGTTSAKSPHTIDFNSRYLSGCATQHY